MARCKWIGGAKNVIQVTKIVIGGTWATNDTITLTIDSIDVVITIGTLVTTSQVATTIVEAFNGTSLTDTSAACSPTIDEGGAQALGAFCEIEAAIDPTNTSAVLLTSVTSGTPFTLTRSLSSGSGTATLTTPTAATGANHWNNGDNWDGGSVPVDGDDIVFDSGNVDCLWNINAAIQPGTFVKTKQYTGRIGLPDVNTTTSGKPFREYRTKYLTFDDNSTTGVYHLESGDLGTGSPRLRLDTGAGASTIVIYGSGTSEITGQPAITIKGKGNVTALGGTIGIAYLEGETMDGTLKIGGGSTTPIVTCGPGFTLTTVDQISGTSYIRSNTTDIDLTGGEMYLERSSAHTNIAVDGGTLYYNSDGTITTLAVTGTLVKGDPRAATITNVVNVYANANISDPHGAFAASAGWKINCRLSKVTLDFGVGRTLAIS